MFDPVKSWIDKMIFKKIFGDAEPVESKQGGRKTMSSPKGHTRSQAVRRIRRQKHQTMLRSVRG